MTAAGRHDIVKLIKTSMGPAGATAVFGQMDNHEDVGTSLIDRFYSASRLAEQGAPRPLGEDVSDILAFITARLKKSCRVCGKTVQPPAPIRPIPRAWTGSLLLDNRSQVEQ